MKNLFNNKALTKVLLGVLLMVVMIGGIFIHQAAAEATDILITAPTATAKKYLQPGATVNVSATITADVAGPAFLKIEILSGANIIATASSNSYELAIGDNPLSYPLVIPVGTAAGTYDIKINAQQPGTTGTLIEKTEIGAVVVDETAPTVALTYNPDKSVYKNGDAVDITATFNEPVLSTPTISMKVGEYSGAPVAMTKTSDTIWTFYLIIDSPYEGQALVTISAQDLAGNKNSPATNNIKEIDNTKPSASITLDDSSLKIGESATITISMSEPVTGFTVDDITAPNGILSGLSGTGSLYTAIFTPTENIEVPTNLISIGTGFTDLAGNAPAAVSTSGNYAIDTKAPIISSVISNATTSGSLGVSQSITFTISLETPEAGLSISSATYNGQVLTWSTADSGATYTATYTVAEGDANQASPLQLTGVKATDLVGNESATVNGTDVIKTIDTAAPVITGVTSNAVAAGVLRVGQSITFTISLETAETDLIIFPTTYNGQALTWSTADSGATYTATYTVVEGEPNQASPLQLTGVKATDLVGNESAAVNGTDVAKTINSFVARGGGGPMFSNSCSAVTYTDWGSCINGFQFRQVASRSSEGCLLTTNQQLDLLRGCAAANDVVVEDPDKETDLSVYIQTVTAREKALTKNVNTELTNRLSGRILLQVEEKGQAWYLEPVSKQRYFMGRPKDAFYIMCDFGLGVSETNFARFQESGTTPYLAGRILLRVENKGEAYYINPADLKMYYLGRPDDAFKIMGDLSLGISNNNIYQLSVGKNK